MSSTAGNPLITKLAAIMLSIGTIPKNGVLDLGVRKVPYVQEFDLLEAVRDKLAEAGVMMFTSDEDVQTEMVERVNARGDRRQACVVTLRTMYTLIDGESGAMFSFNGSGQGEDSGDKALYKAKTGALKYAIRETFLIATGDDPETATQTGRREPIQRPQSASQSVAARGGQPGQPAQSQQLPPWQRESFNTASPEGKRHLAEALRKKGYTDTATVQREMVRLHIAKEAQLHVLIDNLPDLTGGGEPPSESPAQSATVAVPTDEPAKPDDAAGEQGAINWPVPATA